MKKVVSIILLLSIAFAICSCTPHISPEEESSTDELASEILAEMDISMIPEIVSEVESTTEECSTEETTTEAEKTTAVKIVETTTEEEPEPVYYDEPEEIEYEEDAPIPGDLIDYFEITAYEWTGQPMANGEYPYYGACACNRPELWGCTLYIEGIGTFKVCDTGSMSAMGYGVIDIYLGDPAECDKFGRKYNVAVYYA